MKRFKIAVAGCGGMACIWVEYALTRDDAEIVALVDIREEAAKAMSQKYGLSCPVYKDIEMALAESGANIVFDITIPKSHHQITVSALKAGCHVLGEKPMAASLAEAKEMVGIAGNMGKAYAVMQNKRYDKQIRAFRNILQSGAIGQLGFICVDLFLGPHFGGFRDVMDSPYILDMAIHTFDQARFISGADPVSVYCHEFNPAGSWYKGNASAACIFEMSNGAVLCLRASWCAEGNPTSWAGDWRVTGSNGTAMWDGANAPWYAHVSPSEENKFFRHTQKVIPELDWNGKEGHPGCLDEMFYAILEGRKAETDCTDNLKSIAMVFGALESAKKQQKVLL